MKFLLPFLPFGSMLGIGLSIISFTVGLSRNWPELWLLITGVVITATLGMLGMVFQELLKNQENLTVIKERTDSFGEYERFVREIFGELKILQGQISVMTPDRIAARAPEIMESISNFVFQIQAGIKDRRNQSPRLREVLDEAIDVLEVIGRAMNAEVAEEVLEKTAKIRPGIKHVA